MKPRIVSATDLMAVKFSEPRWAVPGVIPEGLTILAAKPKIGKSWLVLGTSIAVASGGRALGQIQCSPGDVLYLALEDNPRRLQSRMAVLLDEADRVPDRLFLVTEWKRLDAGGLEDLDQWLRQHPDARLVVIDTLAKVRPRRKRDGNLYDEDYNALAGLKRLADAHGVAIVLVHHLNKGKADDPFDTISGTLGLSAVADTNLIIERNRGAADALLRLTGRDVEEAVYALQYESSVGGWSILDIPVPDASAERLAVIRAVQDLGPCSPTQVARRLSRPLGTIKRLMWLLRQEGHLLGGGAAYSYSEPGEPADPASRPVASAAERPTSEHGSEADSPLRTVPATLPEHEAGRPAWELEQGSESSEGSEGSPGSLSSPGSGGGRES